MKHFTRIFADKLSSATRLLKRFGTSRSGGGRERSLFDDAYYRRTYSDVSSAKFDRFRHFMTHGWREGRNPSGAFVTLYYRDKHLGGRPVNPLTHYVEHGCALRLPTSPASEAEYIEVQRPLVRPLFDASGYPAFSDAVGGDPLGHYLRCGWRKNVRLILGAPLDEHIAAARYVEQLGVSPLYHYASQKRMAAAAGHRLDTAAKRPRRVVDERARSLVAEHFDANFYLKHNPDVRHAGVDPLDHYLRYGWRENRRPTLLFDPAFYLRAHPDVEASGVNPFQHYLATGRARGLIPNPVGTRAYPLMEAPCEVAWASVRPAADIANARCIVVMPVYKGYGETLAAIHSILSAEQQTSFALHVVDDASPDKDLSQKLDDLAVQGKISLDRNETNLGFIKSVNKALRRFPDQQIILVDADAKVFGNWVDRMIAHLDRDPMIATATPFSNNATIFSYPLTNENNVIELEVDLAAIDRLTMRANAGRCSDVPVGVSFCFLMSVAARKAVGIFDEEFGKGYGQENDFCLRAARAGYRNVLAEDVFAYHVGQVSFGDASGREPPGQRMLRSKHPEYPELVRQHFAHDATEVARIRLDLMRLAASMRPRPAVHVYHASSGGVVTHVQSEIRRRCAEGGSVIIMRVGVGNCWSVEIASAASMPPFTPNLRPLAVGQFGESILDFLRWSSPEFIHIHSLVDFDWSAVVGFMAMVRASQIPYRFTLHDYSVVCHRNNLVPPTNRYCGLPDVEQCRVCVRSDGTYPEAVDPLVRRETYATFLAGADRVIAPSPDIAQRLRQAGAAYDIEVSPHREEELPPIAVAPRVDRPHAIIVTIGAIGAHKGSRIILNLARDARARDLPIRYHIIGYSDVTDDMVEADVTETGRFADAADAMSRAAALSPDFIFLPSIWPETWSYTLSMAFALKVPPVVFDIGAPADRIRTSGLGVVLPYATMNDVKGLNERLIKLAEAQS